MPLLRSLPEQPVMRDLYKSQPASCRQLGELTEVAMRGPSPFTQGQRELIAAYVSGLNACKYCHTTHAGVAAAFGVEPDLFKRAFVRYRLGAGGGANEANPSLREEAHTESDAHV